MTRELEKRICLKAILIALVIIVAGVLFGYYRFSVGIAVGTITGIINFKLLAVRTNIIASSKKSPNPFLIIASFFFRFSLMGTVLWLAIQRGVAIFFGASVGLFMVVIAIYVDSFLKREEKYVANPGRGNSN